MTSSSHNHYTRLEACLSGNTPDRPPVALWRHFPVDDQTPGGLASATAAFQHAYDFDIIKVSPASSFCIKDWGADDRWVSNPEGTRDYILRAVNKPEDWERLQPLNPNQSHLRNQLECLRMLTAEFNGRVPVIQTIFNPLSQAKNLVGPDALPIHMRAHPDAIHSALQTITETTICFVEEVRKTGVDGIFFAVQHAQYGLLSPAEFDTFCRPYDLQILEAAQGLWLNMIHLHGEALMFDEVAGYPAQILNWHDRHTAPSLTEAQTKFTGAVCGGLRQWETMVLGTPDQVRSEALDAIRSTCGKRFILGAGCVLPTTVPRGNILAARQAVEEAVIE